MTTRKQALQDLLGKVEVGEFDAPPESARAPYFNNFMDIAENSFDQSIRNVSNIAWDAYNGSLDAALALHGAVLPGWVVTYIGQDPYDWKAAVFKEKYGPRREGACPTNPARACLIAIIKALITMEEAK